MNAPRRWPKVAVMAALVPVLAAPGTVSAQSSGDGFLFGAPGVTLTVQGGFAHVSAGSDIFQFATEQLTLDRGDFHGGMVNAELAFRLTPRIDLAVGAAPSSRTSGSEFRDWVDQDQLPIEQRTQFMRVPMTVGVKAYLTERGRTVGSFAYVPARTSVYVGADAGAMWYRFRQTGDFVDFQTLDVFTDRVQSYGTVPMGQVRAGAEYTLTPRVALTGEARYMRARAELERDFSGFDPIDLSGGSATLGVSFRF